MIGPRTPWHHPVAAIAALFGLATVVSGGTVLFGGATTTALAGDAVPFVLWFNFLAGFAYVAAAALLWTGHHLARTVAWAIAGATGLVFVAFALAVATGTPFEMRTVWAMSARSLFWFGVAIALGRNLRHRADR